MNERNVTRRLSENKKKEKKLKQVYALKIDADHLYLSLTLRLKPVALDKPLFIQRSTTIEVRHPENYEKYFLLWTLQN